MSTELERAYDARLELLAVAADRLDAETKRQFEAMHHVDRVSFREKSLASFVEKVTQRHVEPPYEQPLIEVEDQVAGRIIVFFVSDLDPALILAQELFGPPVELERKVPARDEEFGYQSDHLIFEIPAWAHPDGWSDQDKMPTMFELQIRTLFQHAYAEPQHNLGYKPSESLKSTEKRELAWIAASAWGADQAYERVRERLS